MPTVFMPLLNEGTSVWRPVEARHVHGDRYVVEGDEPDPDDEVWAYLPGMTVICQPRLLSNEWVLTIVGCERA